MLECFIFSHNMLLVFEKSLTLEFIFLLNKCVTDTCKVLMRLKKISVVSCYNNEIKLN